MQCICPLFSNFCLFSANLMAFIEMNTWEYGTELQFQTLKSDSIRLGWTDDISLMFRKYFFFWTRLQDWDTANLIRIWEVTWGFHCRIIRTTWAASGNDKWGVKGSLSLDFLPIQKGDFRLPSLQKLILNCGPENCPYFLHQPNFEPCKDKQYIAT